MKEDSKFSHILKHQSGGPVQEALPIKFSPIKNPNPFLDFSFTLGNAPEPSGKEGNDDEFEIGLDEISKAKGLMGEKRAAAKKVMGLKKYIDTNIKSNPTWLESPNGIQALEEFQSLMLTLPNELERSVKLFDDAKTRIEKNKSAHKYLRKGSQVYVRDRESGEFKFIDDYELSTDNEQRYTPQTNNDMVSIIEAKGASPFDMQESIYLKNIMGYTKGTTAIIGEIDNALEKVGFRDKSAKEDFYALTRDPQVMDALVMSGFDPGAIDKLSVSESVKDNAERLQAALSRLISSPLGFSPEARSGLRDDAIKMLKQSGEKPKDKDEYEELVMKYMASQLTSFFNERRDLSTSDSTSTSTTDKKANLAVLNPEKVTVGDWNLSAIPVNYNVYKESNGDLKQVQNSALAGKIDYKGVLIGDEDNFSDKVPEDIAADITNSFMPREARVVTIPYDPVKNLPIKQVLEDDMKDQVQRMETEKVERLEELRKSGKSQTEKLKEKAEIDQEYTNKLEALLDKHEINYEKRPMVIMTGYAPTAEGSWFSKGLDNYLKDVDSTKEDNPDMVARLMKAEGELWKTTLYVPLTRGTIADTITTNKYGGKLNLLKVGGRIMSFNDLSKL